MAIRFPAAPSQRSIGMGIDLPWGGELGFAPGADGHDAPTERTRRFVQGAARLGGHLFVSLQARDRSLPRLDDYLPAWDAFFANVSHTARGLHHTALSVGTLVPVDRRSMLAFSAALVERYSLAWVNEDLGLWSLDGQPLPYPLPPVLDARALPAAVASVRECQRALPVPFVIEFPGFSESAGVTLGSLHAYDFFRALAEQTQAPVTLDVGHLLSYQWLRGQRGEALFDELERLPLAHAFELHLAGSSIVDGAFVDAHHGALLDEQLELAERLVALCPALRAVTFEDPGLLSDGTLDGQSAASFERLSARLRPWLEGSASRLPEQETLVLPASAAIELAPLERALAAEVAGRLPPALAPELAALIAAPTHGSIAGLRALCTQRLLERVHRGLGTLQQRFAGAFAAWRERRPEDVGFAALAATLLASDEAVELREGLAESTGACLEEVFAAFAERHALGDPVLREQERASAIMRAIALSPRPAFRIPKDVRRSGRGFVLVTRRGTPVLHAAVDGQYLRGRVTPLIVDLLAGAAPHELAWQHRLPPTRVDEARAELARLGLATGPNDLPVQVQRLP